MKTEIIEEIVCSEDSLTLRGKNSTAQYDGKSQVIPLK